MTTMITNSLTMHQTLSRTPPTTVCTAVISLISLMEKLGIQMSGQLGSLDLDQTRPDGYRDRALATVRTNTRWAFGKGTKKHVNTRDKSVPGVMLSSFVRALTAPGSRPIFRGYKKGTVPRIMGRGVGGEKKAQRKNQKVLPMERILQKCLKRNL